MTGDLQVPAALDVLQCEIAFLPARIEQDDVIRLNWQWELLREKMGIGIHIVRAEKTHFELLVLSGVACLSMKC